MFSNSKRSSLKHITCALLVAEDYQQQCCSDDDNDNDDASNGCKEHTTKFAISGVARICYEEGQRLKLCHGELTVDFRAGCSSCSMTNNFVTNAVDLQIEKAVSC